MSYYDYSGKQHTTVGTANAVNPLVDDTPLGSKLAGRSATPKPRCCGLLSTCAVIILRVVVLALLLIAIILDVVGGVVEFSNVSFNTYSLSFSDTKNVVTENATVVYKRHAYFNTVLNDHLPTVVRCDGTHNETTLGLGGASPMNDPNSSRPTNMSDLACILNAENASMRFSMPGFGVFMSVFGLFSCVLVFGILALLCYVCALAYPTCTHFALRIVFTVLLILCGALQICGTVLACLGADLNVTVPERPGLDTFTLTGSYDAALKTKVSLGAGPALFLTAAVLFVIATVLDLIQWCIY